MLIRSLVESDIDQILAFKLGYHETPWSKKQLTGVLQASLRGTCLVNVGIDDKTRVAIAYVVASYVLDQADVQNIVVDEPFRGLGWGRKILQATTNELGSRGVTELFLEVRPSNQAAVNLYQSMGFKCKQKRQDYYLGVDGMREDAWVFSLKHR